MTQPNKTNPSLQQWLDIVQRYGKSFHRASIQTTRRYTFVINEYLIFCHGKISGRSVLEFKKHLLTKGSRNTANFYIYRLKNFFKWVNNNNIFLTNPVKKVKPFLVESKAPVLIDKNKIDSLVKAFTTEHDSQAAMMFELFYSTGIRTSELRKLRVQDVDLNDKSIRIFSDKHERIVEVPNEVFQRLEKHIIRTQAIFPGTEHIFLGQRGKMIDQREIYRQISKVLFLELNTRKGANTLRHSYINITVSRGAQVISVKNQLGMKSISPLLKYVSSAKSLKPHV